LSSTTRGAHAAPGPRMPSTARFSGTPARLAAWIHCDEARELAAQALTDATMRGRPGEIGIALRGQALVATDGPDIERLHAQSCPQHSEDGVKAILNVAFDVLDRRR
jgi:hypothetical protein